MSYIVQPLYPIPPPIMPLTFEEESVVLTPLPKIVQEWLSTNAHQPSGTQEIALFPTSTKPPRESALHSLHTLFLRLFFMRCLLLEPFLAILPDLPL